MVTKNQINLESFDQRGWIPGPEEDEKSFSARIKSLEHFFSHPPETVDHFLTDRDWEHANKRVKALYGCAPNWIVAHYSNEDLSFFQGGATWIIHKGEMQIPLVQLRKTFESGSLLGLYDRDEVLAHEAVHAIRMEFDEPKFEEIFAYQTSNRWWRRSLGPLFEKTWEAYLFIALLLTPLICEILEILGRAIFHGYYLRLLPVVFFSWLLFRLLFYHFVLKRARKRVKRFLTYPNQEWAVLVRLTDAEIFAFAFRKIEKIPTRFWREKSPRWTLLRQKFFKKNGIL